MSAKLYFADFDLDFITQILLYQNILLVKWTKQDSSIF